ncbi:fimbrial biogenesis chaperone [Serratia fonticola]|uniref:fimbrial biogenesis chaperone n=1 Tax=Serratia fonticola TaxID=47917 RepID=UPI000BFE1CB2|nr:fimbria/pilus periplasmic chaperone [Serratia fonticola]ATM78532.1 chaperone CupB2 [Serratia fonticola]MBC3217840.1 fimbria/pilus periplasmic chaperone [Serratia fonticola]MBC3227945.1 fimbria/pilus periplasmic chaperone [Serratia fonticola]
MKHPDIFFATLISVAVLMLSMIQSVQAAVYIEGTRIIYPANEKEITVKTFNKGKMPALVQVWLDRGNALSQPNNADAPFMVTPPIFRLNANNGQSVRLTYIGENIPQDRESLFWFNTLEIPPLANNDKNYMQVVVRSRLKLFYRPEGLSGEPENAVKEVTWKVIPVASDNNYVLRGENPTPYHVTYSKLELSLAGKKYHLGNAMIPPYSSHDLVFKPARNHTGGGELVYRAVGDYGLGTEQRMTVR